MGKERKVEQIKDNVVVNLYPSVKEAAKAVGVCKQAIQRACDIKQKWRYKPSGYLWRYKCDAIDGEVWRDHPHLHSVKVSDHGRVELPTGVVTKGFKSAKGYMGVDIRGTHFVVSRLVCETYIPNNDSKPTVDHINRVRDDNRLINLRWATYIEQNNNRKDNRIQ